MAVAPLELNAYFASLLAPVREYSANRLALSEFQLRQAQAAELQRRRDFAEQLFRERLAERAITARSEESKEDRKARADESEKDRQARLKEIQAIETRQLAVQDKLYDKMIEKEQELANIREQREEAQRKRIAPAVQDMRRELDKHQKTIDEASVVPVSVRNQFVRRIAQRYTKDPNVLNSLFNPRSQEDLAVNLSRLKKVDLELAQQELDQMEQGYLGLQAPKIQAALVRMRVLQDRLAGLESKVGPVLEEAERAPDAPVAPPSAANDVESLLQRSFGAGVAPGPAAATAAPTTPVAVPPALVIPGQPSQVPQMLGEAVSALPILNIPRRIVGAGQAGVESLASGVQALRGSLPGRVAETVARTKARELLAGAQRFGQSITGTPSIPLTEEDVQNIERLTLQSGTATPQQIATFREKLVAGDPQAIEHWRQLAQEYLKGKAQILLRTPVATNAAPAGVDTFGF